MTHSQTPIERPLRAGIVTDTGRPGTVSSGKIGRVACATAARRALLAVPAAAFLAAITASGTAEAARLIAAWELLSPPAVSEDEDDVRTEDGSPASFSRRLTGQGWEVFASATSTFESQKTTALWSDSRTAYSAGAYADADVRDRFEIGGSGEGVLEFTYRLSGSLSADVRSYFPGDSFDDLFGYLGFNFRARLGTSPFFFSTRVSESFEFSRNDDRIESSGINFFKAFAFMDQKEITMTRSVSAGDELFYNIDTSSRISVGNALGVASANFGSTAELFSVSLSDGLTLAADSGFDYLAVQGAGSQPGGGGTVDIPVPATAWLMGVGLLGLVGKGRRHRSH